MTSLLQLDVVIPVHNREATVKVAAHSVLQQIGVHTRAIASRLPRTRPSVEGMAGRDQA